MSKTVKVRKVGGSLVITVPKDIADLFEIKIGTSIELKISDEESIILKVLK